MNEEKRAGRVYRLPTEAEWEYACRAGTTTAFHAGDSLTHDQANFANVFAGHNNQGTFKVGSFKPNAFGLYDMHGNVWQWCADWYDESYYKRSSKEDPPGPVGGTERVMRGGSWYSTERDCRSARRSHREPGRSQDNIGVRVVCEAGQRR
jgi:formylglycine-generating enzyme required for sulfatase activity